MPLLTKLPFCYAIWGFLSPSFLFSSVSIYYYWIKKKCKGKRKCLDKIFSHFPSRLSSQPNFPGKIPTQTEEIMYNTGEDWYYKLSRKELQSWCKKCGLPARKSTAEMAESLRSYFLRRNLSLLSSGKGLSQEASCPASLVLSPLHAEVPEKLIGSTMTDTFGLRSCTREEVRKGDTNLTSNVLQSHAGSKAYDKEQFSGLVDVFQEASQFQSLSHCAGSRVNNKEPSVSSGGRMEDTPDLHNREMNAIEVTKGNATPCAKTSTEVPSFEFYVHSEEGIRLCVDLNSSPLDWTKKYRNQVFTCENIRKSQSLHQELGLIGETDKQMKSPFIRSTDPGKIKDDHLETEQSPSLIMEKNIDRKVSCQETGDRSLMSSSMKPCSIGADESECLQEDQGKIDSDVTKQILSITDSYSRKSCAAPLDSSIAVSPIEKTACNFAAHSISDGSSDLAALELQNSKLDDDIFENSTLHDSCNVENTSTAFPGCVASCSAEMQLSEAGNCLKHSSCLPLKDCINFDLHGSKFNKGTEYDALVDSSENDQCGSHLSIFSEEQEWSNVVNGRESSVCSQVDNLNFGNVECNEELHRKRVRTDNEDHNGCVKRDAKLLRSMKHSAGDITPRRSMSEFMSHILAACKNYLIDHFHFAPT